MARNKMHVRYYRFSVEKETADIFSNKLLQITAYREEKRKHNTIEDHDTIKRPLCFL